MQSWQRCDFGVTGTACAARRASTCGLPIVGHARLAPAVADPFAGLGKIAAVGIKVSRHRTTHGVALNVAMDLAPYAGIDPCGYRGLRSVDLRTLGVDASWDAAADRLAGHLARRLQP